MTIVLEKLIAARKLIENPEKWTRGAFARTEDGIGIARSDDRLMNAACYCSSGALLAVGVELWDPVWQALRCAMACDTVAAFNDTHTHSEVLEAFDLAISTESGVAV